MDIKPLIIGLTGGIGSGKSEVSRRFEELGVEVVDADEMARVVVEPGQPALQKIAQHFGQDILDNNGRLNRAKLRDIIFSHPHEKQWLEQLLHPLINQLIRQQLSKAKSTYAILVSPLLLETQQYTLVDRVLVVDADEPLQLARASIRDNSNLDAIKAIIATQLSRAVRLERADDVIHNHGDLTELDHAVMQMHDHYLQLSKERI